MVPGSSDLSAVDGLVGERAGVGGEEAGPVLVEVGLVQHFRNIARQL